ncbi:MAG: hypothetical protein ACRDN0_02420 [Trebonia sp.]
MSSPSLWRHRDFLLLWSGQSVSEMGSAVTQLALPLTAVVLLNASTFAVGLLNAARGPRGCGSSSPRCAVCATSHI